MAVVGVGVSGWCARSEGGGEGKEASLTRTDGSELHDDGIETAGSEPGLIGSLWRPCGLAGSCGTRRSLGVSSGPACTGFSVRGWGFGRWISAVGACGR